MVFHCLRTAIIGTSLSCGILVLFLRHYLWIHVPLWISRISHPIFALAQNHPGFWATLHILINAVPDIAFLLLAIAGLAYLMPTRILKRIDELFWVRLVLFIVFVTFGLAAIIINAVNREAEEYQKDQDKQTMNLVLGDVTTIQGSLSPKAVSMTEAERHRHLLDSLRDEYVIEQNAVDPQIVAGNRMPPADWMNGKLKAMGETWKFEEPLNVPAASTSSETIVVKKSQVALPSQPGSDATLSVMIQVNHSGPIEAMNYEGYGVLPVFPDDPDKQRKLEDALWNQVLAVKNAASFQLPSQDENLSVPITINGVAELSIDAVKNGSHAYYFLSHIVDKRGRILLDYCVHVDAKSVITYCRSHNGP